MEKIKVVVTVPTSHADKIRKAMGLAGAGQVGNYSYCSFSVRGIGRFLPNANANPHIGKVGQLEEVEEELIETICAKNQVTAVIQAIIKAHPYEEPGIELIPMFDAQTWMQSIDAL